MPDNYEDADFEDLGSSRDRSGMTRYKPSSVYQVGYSVPSQHESRPGQLPEVKRRWFQSKEQALEELARNIAAGRKAIREMEGLYRDQAGLIAAIVDLEGARELAELRAAHRFKMEQVQQQLALDLAAHQRLENEYRRESLNEDLARQNRSAKQRQHLSDGELEISKRQQANRLKEEELRGARLQKEIDLATTPPPIPAPQAPSVQRRAPKSKAMPPELIELRERAESISKVKRYCDKLRADARWSFETGVIETQNELDQQLDMIEDWYDEIADRIEERHEQ